MLTKEAENNLKSFAKGMKRGSLFQDSKIRIEQKESTSDSIIWIADMIAGAYNKYHSFKNDFYINLIKSLEFDTSYSSL